MSSPAASDFGLGLVVKQLTRRGAGGFEWYKESCLLRRIEVRMRARGVGTLASYAGLLSDDEEEFERLLRSLSIRVTSFFRNPDTWLRLAELLAESDGANRITAWSMGCSTGEEAWSIAMLLWSRRTQANSAISVIGSDVDAHALRLAEAGSYPAASAVPAIRAVLAEPGGSESAGRFEVAAPVRAVVKFRIEDLTATSNRPAWHDLVCCRNVLIFLGREGQRRVLEAARQALRPGGLLLLGRTESLLAIPHEDLVPVDLVHRIYRKSR